MTGIFARKSEIAGTCLIHIKAMDGLYKVRSLLRYLCSEIPMMDVVMLAIAFVFFAVSIGYVYACDQL